MIWIALACLLIAIACFFVAFRTHWFMFFVAFGLLFLSIYLGWHAIANWLHSVFGIIINCSYV
jgi:hypothetical protein